MRSNDRMRLLLLITALLIVFFLTISCGDDGGDDSSSGQQNDDDDDDTADDDSGNDDDSYADDDDDDDDDDDTDPGDPILPSQGFLDRQAEYLAYCSADTGYPSGHLNNQVCAAYTGSGDYNEEKIRETLDDLNARSSACDFRLNVILRLLYFDRDNPTIPDDLRVDIVDAVLNSKYWLDEPGTDYLQWWSENHQLLYHAAELMAGQLFPDDVFPNSGMTGRDHIAHAIPLLNRWLDHRGRFGFAEWHSPIYFNVTMTGLVNLVDFAEDTDIALKGAMLMDEISFGFASNYYQENYATTAGRAHGMVDGLRSSTRESVFLLLGLGAPDSIEELWDSSRTATALATSDRYWPPVILEEIANDAKDNFEHRQSDSLNLEDAQAFGIGFESDEDIMLWWGHSGYVAPEVVMGTFQFLEDYDMWDSPVWSDVAFLRPLVGNPILKTVSELYSPMSRGSTLERVGTYVYRTPYYQIAAAQDYKAAHWTGQNLFWLATLTKDVYVYVTYPGGLPEGSSFGGQWTGGWSPRSTVYKNVGVFQYWRPSLFLLDSLLLTNFSHAFFPKTKFDEFVETGHWTIGRKGDAYLALYSENPTVWSADNDYELIANARENVWIVEMGSMDESGTFTDFVEGITLANVVVGGGIVTYESPSQGVVQVGRTGPMTVDGATVDIGPYGRWDNKYSHQDFGTNVTTIEFDEMRYEMDFETPRRRYWNVH